MAEGRGGSGGLSSPMSIAELIPWLITGALVLIGALTVAIYGMPFESKSDGLRNEQQISQVAMLVGNLASTVDQVRSDQAVMRETLRNLASTEAEIGDVRKTVEAQAIHIEGLEADQKADDSERLAHQGARGGR